MQWNHKILDLSKSRKKGKGSKKTDGTNRKHKDGRLSNLYLNLYIYEKYILNINMFCRKFQGDQTSQS